LKNLARHADSLAAENIALAADRRTEVIAGGICTLYVSLGRIPQVFAASLLKCREKTVKTLYLCLDAFFGFRVSYANRKIIGSKGIQRGAYRCF
jgi:hypothetical protein